MKYLQITVLLLLNCNALLLYAQCPIPFEIENLYINNTIRLDCGDTFQLEVIAPVTDAMLQIEWTTVQGNILAGANTLTPIINDLGTYTVEISATIDSIICVAKQNIQAESFIRAPLNISFPESINCNRSEVMLTAVDDVIQSDYLYKWTTTFGSIISDPNQPNITVNSAGIYNLIRTDLMGNCPANVPVIVFDERIVKFDMAFSPPDCSQTEGMISIVNILGGSGDYSYSIDGGINFQTDPNFLIREGGLYELVVRDEQNACFLTKDTNISFIPIIQDLALVEEIALKKGTNYTLPLSTNLPDSLIENIEWRPAEGLSCTDCLNPSLLVDRNQVYEVTIKDKSGCEAQASIQIIVTKATDIYVPTIFSPNSDGVNDRFTIYANARKVDKIQRLLIFDRYGNLVFERKDFVPNFSQLGWDGRFKGQEVGTGVYLFSAKIDFLDGSTILVSDAVTLVRQ